MNAQKLKNAIQMSSIITDPDTFEQLITTAHNIAHAINPLNPDVSGMANTIINFELAVPEYELETEKTQD